MFFFIHVSFESLVVVEAAAPGVVSDAVHNIAVTADTEGRNEKSGNHWSSTRLDNIVRTGGTYLRRLLTRIESEAKPMSLRCFRCSCDEDVKPMRGVNVRGVPTGQGEKARTPIDRHRIYYTARVVHKCSNSVLGGSGRKRERWTRTMTTSDYDDGDDVGLPRKATSYPLFRPWGKGENPQRSQRTRSPHLLCRAVHCV